jgi:hypothetical protein
MNGGNRCTASAHQQQNGSPASGRQCRLCRQQFERPNGGCGSFAGQREQRLTGYTIYETEPPESGPSPPAPYAALLPASSLLERQQRAPRPVIDVLMFVPASVLRDAPVASPTMCR